MEQTKTGWMGAPTAVEEDGHLRLPGQPRPIIAFLFGVDQSGKLRECDDLKYSRTSAFCVVKAPISPPTWGQIGQMAINIAPSARQ